MKEIHTSCPNLLILLWVVVRVCPVSRPSGVERQDESWMRKDVEGSVYVLALKVEGLGRTTQPAVKQLKTGLRYKIKSVTASLTCPVSCSIVMYRSQWLWGQRQELSSLARTLGSWVPIPLEKLMSVCAFILCLCVLCVGSGLATGWTLVQGVLPTVYIGSRNWKSD
jgi:hypothetical protein